MRELTDLEVSEVDGAITWDARTCIGASILGGVAAGFALGFGPGGAAAGGFLGGWLGDNFCPS